MAPPNKKLDIADLCRQLIDQEVDQRIVNIAFGELSNNQEDPKELIELAAALRKQHNYNASSIVYKFAFSLFPDNHRLWNNHGNLLREWGHLKEALQSFEKSMSIDPNYVNAMEGIGITYERLKEYQLAANFYNKALSIDSERAICWSNLGNCLRRLNDKQKAKQCYEDAIRLDPENPDFYLNLSSLLLELGDWDESLKYIDLLISKWPNDGDALALKRKIRIQQTFLSGFQDYIEGLIYLDKGDLPLPTEFSKHSEMDLEKLKGTFNLLRKNNNSVFISYGWDNDANKKWVRTIAQQLQDNNYQVIFDQWTKADAGEIAFLGIACRNIIMVVTDRFMESSLMGLDDLSRNDQKFYGFLDSDEAIPFRDGYALFENQLMRIKGSALETRI